MANPLLEVERLCVRHPGRGGAPAHDAVRDLSLTIDKGEALGLVGPSGCGKSSAGRAMLRLIPAASGAVRFEGIDVLRASSAALRTMRRRIQIVFQDPGGSLNPRMRVGAIVGEPMLVHRVAKGPALRTRVDALLERCGLDPELAARLPHELSGGQRQRVAIARALALDPGLIVCDEPTSALDVSVQAQILNLLADLRERDGLAYLFISHDLAVVHHLCDRIAVMDEGRIVECGTVEEIVQRPQHPATRRLLAAIPALPA